MRAGVPIGFFLEGDVEIGGDAEHVHERPELEPAPAALLHAEVDPEAS